MGIDHESERAGDAIMNRPAKWERYISVAERFVAEAQAVLGTGLPQCAASLLCAQALTLLEQGRALTLSKLVADLHGRRLRPRECAALLDAYGLLRESLFIADSHDYERIAFTVSLLDATLSHPERDFQLFSLDALFDAMHEAVAFDDGDASRAFLRMARRLTALGHRRGLAELPNDDVLQELADEMPNLRAVVEFYAGQVALARRADKRAAQFPPVLLLGEPGIGKTLLASRLAAALGCAFRSIPMAAQSASWVLTGLDRSWHTAKPGLVFTTLAGSAFANPVVLVDEIDKASRDAQYDPLAGLYTLLERDTACAFVDEYVTFPIDASAVICIATANDVEAIPRPIRSRMMIFEAASPSEEQTRRIIASAYSRITSRARFAAIDGAIVDHLVGLPPRELISQLHAAVGRAAHRAFASAAVEGELRLTDFQLPQSTKRRAGFV